MEKGLPLIVVIGIFSMLLVSFAAAEMHCSVVPFISCPRTSVKVIGITNIQQGGSHASLPTDQTNAFVACCSGIEGLSVGYANQDADIYLTSAREAHVSRVSGENGLKIKGVSCGYFRSCEGYDACVFSISDDRDAHIGECGNYAFSTKLCCRKGGLLGEELEIEPETAGQSNAAGVSAQESAPVQEPAANIPTRTARKALPFHIREFIRQFLRGGMAGSFFRVPQ